MLENIGDRRAAGVAPRQPNYTRRAVFVFVDSMDLATLAALRYARSLRPTSLRAVHFVIDSTHAERLRERWVRFGQDVPFEMIDTPDRRLAHASQELVQREAEQPGTQVTVVLPRRSFSRFSAGCCTTGPPTRSPRRSAGSRTRPPRSSRSTWTAGSGCWRSGRPPGPRRPAGPRTSTRRGNRPPRRAAARAWPARPPRRPAGRHRPASGPRPAGTPPARVGPRGASATPACRAEGRRRRLHGGQADRLAAGGGQGDGGRARDVPGDPAGGAELGAGPGGSR